MTLRHSRTPPSSRQQSLPVAPRETHSPPPYIKDPFSPNDAFPPIPPKKTAKKRRWIGSGGTILRLSSMDVTNRKLNSPHEKRANRFHRVSRKHSASSRHEPVQGDHIRWGGNTVGEEPRDDGLQAGSRLTTQSDRGPQLAGTRLAEDQLHLQLGGDRSQQHGGQQRRRSSLQHWRLFRRRRVSSGGKLHLAL